MLLPKKLYATICASIPVLCVDIVFTWRGKVLLVKRENEPLKGKFWVVGGRVMRGEMLEQALHRLAMDEVGIKIRMDMESFLLGYYEGHFSKSAACDDGIHTVSVVYQVRIPNDETLKIKLDSQSSAYKWDELPKLFTDNLKT